MPACCQVDIRIRVKGGGFTSQLYAIRQAIAKGIVAYTQKCKCTSRGGDSGNGLDIQSLTE